MFKRVILLVLFSIFVYANEYQEVAENFLIYQNSQKTIVSSEVLKKADVEVGYLFNLEGGGYIVVPISQFASPIKAYSFENNFEQLPPPYKEFLLNELDVFLNPKTLFKTTDTTVADRWNFLKNFRINQRALRSYIPNSYLLTSTWNQTTPYNKFFPKVGEDTTLTGCVQTAIGQIMKFHHYPARAKGVYSYDAPIYDANNIKIREDDLTAVLNRDYNWENMPNIFDNTTEEYQEDEVGYLLRDLLVVNKAPQVGVALTSTSANTNALIENFGYSNQMKRTSTSEITKSQFLALAKVQIDKELPFLFSFPTHMTVVDGYRDDLSGNYFHVNMGWGGSANDFYNLDQTVIAGSSTFTTLDLDMIYDIKPCSVANGDCYQNLETNDTLTSSGVSGVFDQDRDSDKYQQYLKGSVTIGGTRGYSEQSFFINIYDSNNSLVSSKNSEVTLNLPADFYTIDVSLASPAGGYYNLDNYTNYTVTITSDILSSSEIAEIDSLTDKAPQIDADLKDKIITQDNKILIHSYDENNEDNLTLSAIGNESVDLSFDKNILTIHPKVTKGFSPITLTATSNGTSVSKEFMVIINDENTSFGKEFSVNGKFDSATEYEKHKVILDGSCTINGYRGYSNQAFYTSVLDINDTVLSPMNTTQISLSNLAQNFYFLGASLKENPESVYGGYYTYNENYSSYTLSVSCPNADENITKIAALLGIDISVSSSSESSISSSLSSSDSSSSESSISSSSSSSDSSSSESSIASSLSSSDSSSSESSSSSSSNSSDSSSSESSIASSSSSSDSSSSESNSSLSITYPSGWSLKSLPVQTTLDASSFSAVTTVWKYRDGKWIVYSPNVTMMNKISALGLETLTSVTAGQGFWINASVNGDINVTGHAYNIETIQNLQILSVGWHLLGNGVTTSVTTLINANPNISIIWKYLDNKWFAYSPDSETASLISNAGFESLSDINSTEGFWIYIK